MNQWQPIASVPKDGTKVLVYMPNYTNSKTKIEIAQYHPNVTFIGNLFHFDYAPEELPTHWMHLPEIPKE